MPSRLSSSAPSRPPSCCASLCRIAAPTRAILKRARNGGIWFAPMSESNEAKGADFGASGASHRNKKMGALCFGRAPSRSFPVRLRFYCGRVRSLPRVDTLPCGSLVPLHRPLKPPRLQSPYRETLPRRVAWRMSGGSISSNREVAARGSKIRST